MIEQLKAKLTPAELKARTGALDEASAYVDKCATCGGVDAQVRKSFNGSGPSVRVDIEVSKGKAFVPEP